jgi:thioredoxin-like negative regulator of GroEL
MTSILLATIVQATILATGAEEAPLAAATYAEARQTVTETGTPMVVMVSTDWCPPCQTMKKTILPRVRERGLLKKVAFAIVNPDRDRDLAEKLTGGGPIPQLLMFRKTPDGWVRKKLVGGQSVETVEEFIVEGLAKDLAEKEAMTQDGDKSVPESEETSVHHDAAIESEEAAQHG